MELNIDPDWLIRMAEKEANCNISVGGLITQISKDEAVTEPKVPTPNRVTPEEIQKLLDGAEKQEQVFFGKVLVVVYRFHTRGGFTVVGKGSCIDPKNFDLEIGRRVAREDVEHQLWQLEGYLRQVDLSEQGFLG